VAGAKGKHAATIDEAAANAPARESTLSVDAIELQPFATMLVHWKNASGSGNRSI